jgi:RimJ/RimL family protein N-acetyltransferase
MRLETDRLYLDPFVVDDVDALCTLYRAPYVRRYLCDDQTVPRELVEQIVQHSTAMFAAGQQGQRAMRLRRDPRYIIGFVGFSVIEGQRELGFGIHEFYAGRKMASEAARAVIVEEFKTSQHIIAAADEPNQPSHVLLKRLGFAETHRRPNPHTGLDIIYYKLDVA